MPWWGWLSAGMLLLAAELFLVEADFYFVFLGVSALLVGGAELIGLSLPYWMQWTAFALVTVASLVFFRRKVYDVLRGGATGEIAEGVTGDTAVAQDAIAPGARGRVELRGTAWAALNCGTEPIGAGARCRVERSDGLTLEVRAET